MKTSAWTRGMATAPKDRMILIRSPWGVAPVVIEWKTNIDDVTDGWWVYSDEYLDQFNIDPAALAAADCEWALIPE